MMPTNRAMSSLWWLIHKDLQREFRAHHVWPGMLLLGLVLVFLLATQLELPSNRKSQVAGGMLWLAVFFAGSLACERSFAGEREAGCWQTLALYPIAPALHFLSKLIVTFITLVALECVLVPVYMVLCDLPPGTLYSGSAGLGHLILVAVLGNVGFAAAGTVVSALAAGLRHRGSLVALLLLPLLVPVILGSAEATRLLLAEQAGAQWWLWIQLLGVFALVFTVVGALVFEYVMED